jgi:hypothetical protein
MAATYLYTDLHSEAPMTRAGLLSLATLLTVCLVGSPGEATPTFTESGTALTPCAEGLCLDWQW